MGMRNFRHQLTVSKSGKSALLRVEVSDSLGKRMINLSRVTGWRKDLALKHLSIDSEDWNLDTARVYLALETLKLARDRYEGFSFINTVKSLSSFEVHFWASKFLSNDKARRAWRVMYG